MGLPGILGYVTVGLILGRMPSAHSESDTRICWPRLGVVFLLHPGPGIFWPRMVALRREVFGLGSLRVFRHGRRSGAGRPSVRNRLAQSIVLGGAGPWLDGAHPAGAH